VLVSTQDRQVSQSLSVSSGLGQLTVQTEAISKSLCTVLFGIQDKLDSKSLSMSSGLEQLTVQTEVMQIVLVVSHMYSQFKTAMYSSCQHPGQVACRIIVREQWS